MGFLKIAFRTDANSQIGTGHFMRCLTLAEALKKYDAKIRFVCREIPQSFQDMLKAKDMELASLDTVTNASSTEELAHSHWLGTSQKQDARATIHVLSDESWDWLIADHYALNERWESLLRQTAKKIMVIDDIADRSHDCDVLLDQNFYANLDSRYIGKVPAYCQLLLGPRHALLRDEFRQLHDQIKPRRGPVKRIVIFFGGVDAGNYTGVVIDVLSRIDIPELHVDVVIGSEHPSREQIKEACARHGFVCHIQTERMAELMATADLAIGAGGSASWERCCLGLPVLLVTLADNQVEIAKALHVFGACLYVGAVEIATMSVIRNAIFDIFKHPDELASMSEKSYSLVDGLGVDRVCQAVRC